MFVVVLAIVVFRAQVLASQTALFFFMLLLVLLFWHHMALFIPLQSVSIVVIVVIGVVVSVIVDTRLSFVKEAMTTITLLNSYII